MTKETNGLAAIMETDYVLAMRIFHAVALDLEPNDGVARAALVNTAMIALTNGKIKMEESEPWDETPPPPADENTPPWERG